MQKVSTVIPRLIDRRNGELLSAWLSGLAGSDSQTDASVRTDQATRFLAALRQGVGTGQLDDISAPGWTSTREVLETVSRERAQRGATPAETASFVLSLKEPLFEALRREAGKDIDALAAEIGTATRLLDKLGLYTVDILQKSREAVILRQREEMLELSTPVVQLWSGILALPLIGTLDSSRTQVVMENLLQHIVTSGAEIAIIDITGVPTVDTLVAQHLLKTISAARLMGADCIISGIRPQIAQTMVHLGVELDVVSKSTMADALSLALRRIGKVVVDRAKPARSVE
jgi:rsbT co-antagonist protein RsbR